MILPHDAMPGNIQKILLVDDSEVIRERLVRLISTIENTKIVGEADNTRQAIELSKSTLPDYVILDLSIPEDGGFYVLELIKEITPDAIVIILTNYYDDAYREHCYSLGADYFFEKSKDFNKVKSALLNS